MRRAGLAVALALCAAAPASGHPGHGAEAVNIQGDTARFTPGEVTVGVGDAVVWFWNGTFARNHSVTADPGQAETFDSDPAGPPTNETHPPGDSFSHTFRTVGRFTYHCQVHATMTGVVNVVEVPAGARPLRLSGFRVIARGDGVEARFRLSRRADLVGRVSERRRGDWRAVDTFNATGRKGRNEVEVPSGSLDADHRYRLALTAYDFLNRRASARDRFSLAG
jgi:plastocyanin